MTLEDASLLRCPACSGELAYKGSLDGGRLGEGSLACARCAPWPVALGLPKLYREADVTGSDKLMRRFYDGLPKLHDPVVRYTLPVFQRGTERALRDAYMKRVELGALAPRRDRPLRILEVGVGTGANIPLLYRDLPPGLDVELWGLDLSIGMIRVLTRRSEREGWAAPRLVLGDAHALPFPDASFDRVFHVGGINGFRDRRRAIAELARVAVPGSPIVIADEQLAPEGSESLYHRALFRLVTFYDAHPRCPLDALPEGAHDVLAEQASLFFYCLRFRMPAPKTALR